MEILWHHTGIGAVVGAVAGVVENDVGIDFQIHLVGIVREIAQRGARAVAGLPMPALRGIAEVEAVEQIVAHISTVGVRMSPRDRRLARRRSPDGLVSYFRDLGQPLIDFIPTRLEVLDDNFRLDSRRGGKDSGGGGQ